MHVRSLLNKVYHHKGFVYANTLYCERRQVVIVDVRARKGSKPICSGCGAVCPGYDVIGEREFFMVPIWGVPVRLRYCMRRVNCAKCRVRVERVPWATGKSPMTTAFAHHLAGWARLQSRKEVGKRCGVSWDLVASSVEWLVAWGKEHRSIEGVEAIGVDEIQYKKGHKYLTLVYQLDSLNRRLLWVGKERTIASFNGFFDEMGSDVCSGIKFVCSDMWRAYAKVIARRVPEAVHILDRFHIVGMLSKAVDQTRRDEVRELRKKGRPAHLHKSRWVWLKRRSNLTPKQRSHLSELLAANLRTVKAYLLKEAFDKLWTYTSPAWAAKFLDSWCTDVMRHRSLPSMKKFARSLRQHRELILNYFRAKSTTQRTFSSGVVEGFNNKAKLCIRKSYGFRSDRYREVALFHALGNLPEPEFTHRFS